MSNYFARIVLHRTDGTDDYPELHVEMEKLGFARTVKSTQNEHYTLPGGLYCFDKNEPVNTFRNYQSPEMAYTAISGAVERVIANDKAYIKAANTPPSILVIASGATTWSGLAQVPKAPIRLKPRRTLRPRNPLS